METLKNEHIGTLPRLLRGHAGKCREESPVMAGFLTVLCDKLDAHVATGADLSAGDYNRLVQEALHAEVEPAGMLELEERAEELTSLTGHAWRMAVRAGKQTGAGREGL